MALGQGKSSCGQLQKFSLPLLQQERWQVAGQQFYTEKKKWISPSEHKGNKKRIVIRICSTKSYGVGMGATEACRRVDSDYWFGKWSNLDHFSFMFSCCVGVSQSDKRAWEGSTRRYWTASTTAWSQWSNCQWRNVCEHRHLHGERWYWITSRFIPDLSQMQKVNDRLIWAFLFSFYIGNNVSPNQKSQNQLITRSTALNSCLDPLVWNVWIAEQITEGFCLYPPSFNLIQV